MIAHRCLRLVLLACLMTGCEKAHETPPPANTPTHTELYDQVRRPLDQARTAEELERQRKAQLDAQIDSQTP